MKKNYYLLLILCCCLTSCGKYQRVDMDQAIQQFSNIDDFTRRLGAPESSAKLSNGSSIYTYVIEHRSYQPGYFDYFYKCQLNVEAQNNGTVVRSDWRSNDNHPYQDACTELLTPLLLR